MPILYITSDHIQTKMSPVGRDIFDGLCRVADVTPYGPGFPDFRGDRLPEVIASAPRRIDLVIVDENTLLESLSGFRISSLADVDVPKAQFVVDYHSAGAQRRDFCRRNRIDVVITRYEAGIPVVRNYGVPHVVHCPHTVSAEDIPSPPAERRYDVAISGAMLQSVYPFRVRLFRLLTECKDLRTLCVPHPGYRDLASVAPDAVVGRRYYATLADSRLGIATSSIFKLPLRKYLEIAACHTTVAGDIPERGFELTRDHVLRLNARMSDDEIVSALRRGVERFDSTSGQREELAQRVLSYYAPEAVARRLLRDIARCLAAEPLGGTTGM